MDKIFIVIGVFLCSFLVEAQSSSVDNVNNKNVTSVSLNKKFNTRVLNAYQENSKTKIEDLYSYFQLLTDASLTDDLKNEVVKNINLLFQNPTEMVVDFTSQSLDKISLNQFIQKLLISEPILFSISEESKFNAIDYNSWKTEYNIESTKSGLVSKTKIVQKVYFYEKPKAFGTESKVVYSTLLGNME